MSVTCQNVTLKHKKQTMIENFTLELKGGKLTAFYGPTGSGKTALLLMLAGLMKPTSGEIIVDGIHVTKSPRKARQSVGLGVIPQFSPLLSKLNLEENLLLQAKTLKVSKPKDRVKDVLHELGLERYARVLTDDLPALVSAQASLALALLNESPTLLLDEPEYRLTTEETETLWSHFLDLRNQDKTIIISTRSQEVAAKCDQVILIPQGKEVEQHATEPTRWSGAETALA
ncbi:ATP-binding cassette domain-containing protein [Desulfosporosinus sp. Sb-LF]|uniref:ATP-binding cassette domain-containing protein n=1 Tax=Desulfosporosinus sp. Sb-LF TaxID=2560027 RepID=UPI00130520F7|nr:ATP-binding cassette domain-containing protein [Desulfosporosinus sp. Sb-LF]